MGSWIDSFLAILGQYYGKYDICDIYESYCVGYDINPIMSLFISRGFILGDFHRNILPSTMTKPTVTN